TCSMRTHSIYKTSINLHRMQRSPLPVGFLISLILVPGIALSQTDQRTAWYREAKFGMFIHWGPYSVASVEASWPIMRPSKEFAITEQKYRSLPQEFDPAHFDPDTWVALAKSAGQRYMVFTTKHHDGFCMFDSV